MFFVHTVVGPGPGTNLSDRPSLNMRLVTWHIQSIQPQNGQCRRLMRNGPPGVLAFRRPRIKTAVSGEELRSHRLPNSSYMGFGRGIRGGFAPPTPPSCRDSRSNNLRFVPGETCAAIAQDMATVELPGADELQNVYVQRVRGRSAGSEQNPKFSPINGDFSTS